MVSSNYVYCIKHFDLVYYRVTLIISYKECSKWKFKMNINKLNRERCNLVYFINKNTGIYMVIEGLCQNTPSFCLSIHLPIIILKRLDFFARILEEMSQTINKFAWDISASIGTFWLSFSGTFWKSQLLVFHVTVWFFVSLFFILPEY